MSDFAGQEFDFAAGSIKGLRGWGMDELGRLHGVTHREVWRPGENVSVCKKEAWAVPCPQINRREEARRASEAGRAQLASKKKRRKRDEVAPFAVGSWRFLPRRGGPLGMATTVGWDFTPRTACGDPACVRGEYHLVQSSHRFDASCQCGFWAYDEAGFKPHGDVIGVIEGYGKVTVGTKGFRAEKARIVAISCESGGGERHPRSVLARLTTLYPDASFANNLGELIDEHPEVLRTWPEVGEDFWIKPVRDRETFSVGGLTMPSSYYRLMQSLSVVPSSTLGRGGSI